jgi:hypothetical protein
MLGIIREDRQVVFSQSLEDPGTEDRGQGLVTEEISRRFHFPQTYYEDPKPIVPPPTSDREKQPRKLQVQTRSMRVDKWVQKQALGAWRRVAIRDSSKGKIFVDILHRIIWLWDCKEPEARRWHLVVRREIDSPEEIIYSLSNASLDTQAE